jgi:tetratricopeptide (TPR) repeat protein
MVTQPRRSSVKQRAGRGLDLLLAFALVLGCASAGPRWENERKAGDRLLEKGDVEAAHQRYEAALQAAVSAGSDHGRFLATSSLAELYMTYPELGREDEAPELWLETLALAERAGGLEHHNVGWAAYRLGESYALLEQWPDACAAYEGAVAVFTRVHGPDDSSTQTSTRALEAAQRQAGDASCESELAERIRTAALPAEDAMPELTSLNAPSGIHTSPSIDLDATYLRWNVQDVDGTWAFVHLSPDDMPLRVAIGLPQVGARDGSRRATREAAIQAIELWERAVQPDLPWFELQFVKEDPSAPVQVVWKRRMAGSAAGRGTLRYSVQNGKLRVGGSMWVTMQPHFPESAEQLTLAETRRLISHEFGHVLGLGHCLDCDSVMNYSWETLERAYVTELDALTFRALVEQPNGIRQDGGFLRGMAVPTLGAD